MYKSSLVAKSGQQSKIRSKYGIISLGINEGRHVDDSPIRIREDLSAFRRLRFADDVAAIVDTACHHGRDPLGQRYNYQTLRPIHKRLAPEEPPR